MTPVPVHMATIKHPDIYLTLGLQNEFISQEEEKPMMISLLSPVYIPQNYYYIGLFIKRTYFSSLEPFLDIPVSINHNHIITNSSKKKTSNGPIKFLLKLSKVLKFIKLITCSELAYS